MIQLLIPASGRLSALIDFARPIVCLSRILLLVVALELITMPVTQGLWSWDKFLHGGQDFELGLLVIITCLCLLLLRAEQSKLLLGMLLLFRAMLVVARKIATSCSSVFSGRSGHRPSIPPETLFARVNLPLLI